MLTSANFAARKFTPSKTTTCWLENSKMKITSPIKNLIEQVNRLARIPGARGLHGTTLRLTADIAGLTMQRSTGECLASVTAEAEVETETENPVDVGFELLSGTLSALPGEAATLEFTPGTLFVRSGKSSQRIPIAPDDWVQMEVPAFTHTAANAEKLAAALRACIRAVGNDIAKPLCQGLHFLSHEQALWCVGSDGRRVHAQQSGLNGAVPGFHLGTEAVQALLGIIGDAEIVNLGATDNAVNIIGPDFEIVLTQMADRLSLAGGIKPFMFPAKPTPIATLPVAESTAAIRFAARSSEDGSVDLSPGAPKSGSIFILAHNNSGALGQTEIECKHALTEALRVPGAAFAEMLECAGTQAEIGDAGNFINVRTAIGAFSVCKMKVAK